MASNTENSTNSSYIQSLGICTSPLVMHTFTPLLVLYLISFFIYLSVLYILYQKWRKEKGRSHFDVIILHMMIMEELSIVGLCLLYYGAYTMIYNTGILLGRAMSILSHTGQKLFHVYTCVDRYLAVVHPITYLRLKESPGVIIRNIFLGLAWLLSIGLCSLAQRESIIVYHKILCLLLALTSFAIVSICTIVTLCVLDRSGPGDRKTGTHSKRAALNTMVLIMGAELLDNMNSILFYAMTFTGMDTCLLALNMLWFKIQSSLVLPLLRLHRIKKNSQEH